MKKRLISSFYENKQLFFVYALFLLISCITIITVSNTKLFLTINLSHSTHLDSFFLTMTKLGEGEVTALIAVILLGVHTYKGIGLLSTFVLSSTITQFFKRFIFSDVLRPAKYFENKNLLLHFVEGEKISYHLSFPSGHTTTVFCLSIFIIFIIKNPYLKVVLFGFAMLSGYSRIYLGQHFPIDVVAGSFVGFVSSFFIYSFFKPKISS